MAEQSKTYCPLPFIHSHAGLNGKYKPCCNSDSLFNHWEYHIEKLGYDDWFRHPEMNQLRKDLLTGVKNKKDKIKGSLGDVPAINQKSSHDNLLIIYTL